MARPTDPALRNVADQRRDPRSVLALYRELIALRRELTGELRLLDAAPGVVAYARGEHLIAVNAGDRPARPPDHGEVVLTSDGSPGGPIAPGEGLIARI